mgnify:CR=1 FL=1|jgi:hypothetical protein
MPDKQKQVIKLKTMSETSQKQIEANRQNAKLGGVKTEEGKVVNKYNALKHGVLSKDVLPKGEDEKSLEELDKHLRAEIKPVKKVEMLFTDRIISNVWHLRRMLGLSEQRWNGVRSWNFTTLLTWIIPQGSKQHGKLFGKYLILSEEE